MVCLAANYFAANGHQVSVVYSPRPETPTDLESLFHRDVVLHALPMGPRDLPGGILEARRKLKELNPDVLHMHSSFAGFVGRLATIGWKSDLKSFYSPHCISFMRTDISDLKKRIFTLLEAIAAKRHGTYIACSRSEALAIEDSLGLPALILENAVDVGFFTRPNTDTPLRAHRPDKRLTVVTVGGIRRQKGFDLFSDISRLLSHRGFEFVWIGDGDLTSKAALTDAGVRVTGWRTRQEVRDMLHSADVYLSTAAWEGMPVSVIEAMASGLPVLANRCPGNVDVVDDEVNGVLFSGASEAVGQLERLYLNTDLRTQIAHQGEQAARGRFAQSRFLHQLEQIYIQPSRVGAH